MLDRTVAPPFAESFSFDLIKPERTTTRNGADIFFVRGGSQDVLKIEVIFKAGRWFESTWGASYFAANLISKGTKYKSSFQIASIFDQYGAHLEIGAGLDNVSIALYALNKHLTPALSLLLELLTAPVFPEKELEQMQAIHLQNLKVNNEKTSFVASKIFRRNLFGDSHPYGKELDESDVMNLNKKSLEDHFNAHFKDAVIFVSGKISSENEKLIVNTFAGLQPFSLKNEIDHSVSVQAKHQHEEKDGSVQATIRFGKRSILRSHPDYSKAIFISHILGGYFGSRLMKNIREEKGLTYGIYSSLQPMQHDSSVVIGADVNKENVRLTFDEIRKELRIMRTEPVGQEELITARNHFIGSLQSEIATPFAHADKLKTIYLLKLDSNYYSNLIDTLKAITTEDVLAISEKHFHEESFFEIAVG